MVHYATEEGGLVPAGTKIAELDRPAEETMYDRLGIVAIRTVVDKFYERVFADPDLVPWFGDLSDARRAMLRRHQVWLVAQLLGGPVIYEMGELAEVHQRLDPQVTPEAFARVCTHLLAVLGELRVPADVVAHLSRSLDSVRDLIVGHVDE